METGIAHWSAGSSCHADPFFLAAYNQHCLHPLYNDYFIKEEINHELGRVACYRLVGSGAASRRRQQQ